MSVTEPMPGRDFQPQGEFSRGWKIVLGAFLGIGLGLSPLPFYTIGVFAPHLAKAFGWSMSQIMFGLTMTTFMVLWAGPLVGILVGKYGVRKMALTSLVAFGLAFIAMAFNTGSLALYYTLWSVIAIAGAGTLPITWTRAVNRWFDRRKGLALGLVLSGTGLFGILSKPYLAWIIGSYGWRVGYVGIGLLPLLIAFPVAFFLFHDAEEPDSPHTAMATPGGLTLVQTLREWRFWLLALALVPISICLSGTVPNLESILKSSHVPPETILKLTPLVGLSAIMGRLAGGWLMDRIWAPAVGFVILSLPAISFWLLAAGSVSFGTGAVAILLIGFALGVEYDLMAYLLARYFGLYQYSAIYGVLYVFYALGAGFGPLLFGWAFDHYGNYHLALTVSSVVLVAVSASLLTFGRYREFADRVDDSLAAA